MGNNGLLKAFRATALLEGISYIVLLFIAMPLKYLLAMPLMVRYVGWAHGVLFVFYFALLAIVFFKQRWPLWKVVVSAIASLLPFGTFFLDAKLLKHEVETA